MSMEDITKAPPGDEPDGVEEGHSLAASDGKENRPNGHDPQAKNEDAGEPWPWWFDPEFALENLELFIWTNNEDGTISCRRRRDDDDEGSL
jgi:hypothetical protein